MAERLIDDEEEDDVPDRIDKSPSTRQRTHPDVKQRIGKVIDQDEEAR